MRDVDDYKYGDDRSTLATEQTERYMSPDDKRPVPVRPDVREHSGPVLLWDRAEDLNAVRTDAGPLYIAETIHPWAFTEQLRSLKPAPLFDEFDSLPVDATYEWYRHKGDWMNRLIRGDSVRVMASLLAKEGMEGKVQMIYMDPRPTASASNPTSRPPPTTANPQPTRKRYPPTRRSSKPSATPTKTASTPTSTTSTATSPTPAPCSPNPAASSSKSAPKTSTASHSCWTRCSEQRIA